MNCTNWNLHDTKLLNMGNFAATDQYFNKPVLQGTFAGYSGSSVIPTAKNVNISGCADYSPNIAALTTPAVNSSTCVNSPLMPIVSDCGGLDLFGGFGGFGCYGGYAVPFDYFTRTGQAIDKTDALGIYKHTSWSTILGGSLKNNVIDMMSSPSGTIQSIGLAAKFAKGLFGCIGNFFA